MHALVHCLLVAAKHNTTLDQALRHIQPNCEFYLKSPAQMAELFPDVPEAMRNTQRIAERCTFNLDIDLGYTLPEPLVPEGSRPRRICVGFARKRR